MTPEIFTACEGASCKGGQWCLLHTFSNYLLAQLPGVVQGIVVTQVRFRADEEGEHAASWVLTGPDGAEVWRADSPFFIKLPPRCETFAYANMTMLQAEVWVAGQHDLRLLVDGRELMATPLGISLLG